MLEAVDALLRTARETLGTGTAPSGPPAPRLGEQLTPPATWHGDSSARAHQHNTDLDTTRATLRTAHHTVSTLVTDAAAITRDAHTREVDKAALNPLSDTAEGRAALIRAAMIRVGEATEIINETATQFSDAAKQVPALDARLFQPLQHQIPPPQAGYVVIWCTPSGPGFLCEWLWPSGNVTTGWCQWDLTGGQPC